jgi:hypothetical protein
MVQRSDSYTHSYEALSRQPFQARFFGADFEVEL